MSDAATTGSGLTDYDKGYLDGLLEASRHAGAAKRLDVYKADAERYLSERGFKGWKANAKRI